MAVERIVRTCRRRSQRLAEKNKEARRNYVEEYWRRVWESDGFEIDHLKGLGRSGMRVFKCEPDDYPVLLHLYAKMGLHRYNMLQGTNLQLHHIKKYNRYFEPIPTDYFITLAAKDPSSIGSLVTFQTSIHEKSFNAFDVRCYVARPKSKETKCTLWDDETAPEFLGCTAPEWPSDDALANRNRFYLVQESDLKEYDWIRLYMELAFVTTNRMTDNVCLSDLKIVEVVVETEQIVNPPNEKLKGARNAMIYIEYEQDLGEDRFRKYRARIRRSVDLRTSRLSLVGKNQQVTSEKMTP